MEPRPIHMRVASAAILISISTATRAQPLVNAKNTSDIDVGVLAVLDDPDTRKKWQALLAGLSKALPHRQLRFHPLALPDLEQNLGAGSLDFEITNPGHYVVLEARCGATRIATQTVAQGGDPANAVGSAVVVRASGHVPAKLEGLAGRKVAAVAEDAFGGYQLVAAQWLSAGLDAGSSDIDRLFTDYPMTRVLDALLQAQADAAILRTACSNDG